MSSPPGTTPQPGSWGVGSGPAPLNRPTSRLYNEQPVEQQRFRSFVERYVVERAGSFRPGYEKEDGWLAVEDARVLFDHINNRSVEVVCRDAPDEEYARQKRLARSTGQQQTVAQPQTVAPKTAQQIPLREKNRWPGGW